MSIRRVQENAPASSVDATRGLVTTSQVTLASAVRPPSRLLRPTVTTVSIAGACPGSNRIVFESRGHAAGVSLLMLRGRTGHAMGWLGAGSQLFAGCAISSGAMRRLQFQCQPAILVHAAAIDANYHHRQSQVVSPFAAPGNVNPQITGFNDNVLTSVPDSNINVRSATAAGHLAEAGLCARRACN